MSYPWHDTPWQQIHTAEQAGHLPHALLFSGLAGCGHEAFVKAVARRLLCLSPQTDGRACKQCRSCEVFQSNAHPDFAEIAPPEDKQIIGIEQVRNLTHFLELSRSYSPVRVAMIWQAESLNVNAANSLLKSLEEPAQYTYILLQTHQPQALLATIRSRCQQIRLPLPSRETARQWLAQQNTVQTPEALLKLANGRPLRALELDSGELLALHEVWAQQLYEVLNGQAALATVGAEWAKQSRQELLDWQLSLLQHLIRQQMTGCSGEEAFDGAEKLAAPCRNKDLWALYDQLLELKALATHPLNNTLLAENMLALWAK